MSLLRPLTLALIALLLLAQHSLWLGEGGWRQQRLLRQQLQALRAENDEARQTNERLAAEVVDLREGLEMVEERARAELGMVKPDELFVQYAARSPAPADALSP